MNDLKLNRLTHDLELNAFDLQVVGDIDYVAQKLKIRLWFLYREWFLDTTQGVPYHDYIWVKIPNIPKVETIIKATILETDGVNELLSFSTSFDRLRRSFTVDFTANTLYGDLSITETI